MKGGSVMNHAHMKGPHFMEWWTVGMYTVVAAVIALGAYILFPLARGIYAEKPDIPVVFESHTTGEFFVEDTNGNFVPTKEPPAPYEHYWVQ